MKAFFVGTKDYATTLKLQETLFAQKIKRQLAVARGETSLPQLPDVTLFVEHSQPVYTIGRRDTTGGLPAHCDIAVAKTKRGGGITYHGPGQVTVYPIANIQQLWKRCTNAQRPRSPIEWFSAALEKMMIDTASSYGVPTHSRKTGVWSDEYEGRRPEKMGSIGLQLGSWVSMHGAGFNVDPDLQYFDHIVMCELPGESATSLAQEIRRRRLSVHVPDAWQTSCLLFDALQKNFELTECLDGEGELCNVSSDPQWAAAVLQQSGYEEQMLEQSVGEAKGDGRGLNK